MRFCLSMPVTSASNVVTFLRLRKRCRIGHAISEGTNEAVAA